MKLFYNENTYFSSILSEFSETSYILTVLKNIEEFFELKNQ